MPVRLEGLTGPQPADERLVVVDPAVVESPGVVDGDPSRPGDPRDVQRLTAAHRCRLSHHRPAARAVGATEAGHRPARPGPAHAGAARTNATRSGTTHA